MLRSAPFTKVSPLAIIYWLPPHWYDRMERELTQFNSIPTRDYYPNAWLNVKMYDLARGFSLENESSWNGLLILVVAAFLH